MPDPTPIAPSNTVLVASHSAKKGRPMWSYIVAALVLVGVIWLVWSRIHASSTTAGPIVTGTVKRGDLIETVTATGSIAAQTGAQIKIGSQITGRIKHLYADVGTKVKAGDLIAELDLPDVDAQLAQVQALNASAKAKLVQQQQNVSLGLAQTADSITLARANVNSAQERLKAAQAAEQLQIVQTPADIKRAQAVVNQSVAALSTAKSTQVQVQTGANLQIETSKEAVAQAVANNKRNQIELTRQQALVAKGYVAQSVVDVALQAASVSASLVRSQGQLLILTQQKMAADLQSASDQVVQAQQAVDSAKAALKSAQAEIYSTSSKTAAVKDAVAAVAASQANLQIAIADLTTNDVRVQDVRQAQQGVAQTAAQIAANQAQVDKTFIRTPISGTVIQMAAQQGETLAAGLSAPTLIIVADLKRLEVDAYVDETDIGKVKIGQTAQITVDAFSDKVLTGKITKIAAGSTIQQSVVTYGVTISFDANDLELKPDMTASVTIKTGQRTNVLVVPSVAIQVGVNGSTVNVLDGRADQGKIKSVPVKTGGTDGVNTEIVSGLTENQTIVLAGGQSATKRAGTTSSSPFGGAAGGGRGGGGGPGGGGGGPPRG